MKYVVTLATTAALAWVAHALDLAKDFGAHPWWSKDIIVTGAAIGLAIAMALHFIIKKHAINLTIAAFSAAAAFGVAKYGQTQFAASYAEDAFAGTLWFFGWHATSIAISATLALIVLSFFGTGSGAGKEGFNESAEESSR